MKKFEGGGFSSARRRLSAPHFRIPAKILARKVSERSFFLWGSRTLGLERRSMTQPGQRMVEDVGMNAASGVPRQIGQDAEAFYQADKKAHGARSP